MAGAALVVHMVGIRLAFRALGQPLPSNVPVNPGARAGHLAFQLPLGGPSEELLLRALPITGLAALGCVVLTRRWACGSRR